MIHRSEKCAWRLCGAVALVLSTMAVNPSASASPAGQLKRVASGEEGPVLIPITKLEQKEAALTSFEGMTRAKHDLRTLDNAVVEKIAPGSASNPPNVKRVEAIVSEQTWEYLFPRRNPSYTYQGFLQAVGKFPALCDTYSTGNDAEAICRKSLATMFAHFAQETGEHDEHSSIPPWRQGLHHVREMGWNEEMPNGYNSECNPSVWQGQGWPCGTFAAGSANAGQYKSYFGRGAKQLSYNYNYGPFSQVAYGDVRPLLDHPEWVADTWLNLASAAFFFVYPQTPKPSMLQAVDGTWKPNAHDDQSGRKNGFGITTLIINGGVECGGPTEGAQSTNRISYYRAVAQYLKVPVPDDEVLGCKNMKVFDEASSAVLPSYWVKDDSWDDSNPGGKSYACKLVNYQDRFSAFTKGDYVNCVKHYYPEVVVTGDSGGGNQPPVPWIVGPSVVFAGATVNYSGDKSVDPEGKPLTYEWTLPSGVSLVAGRRDTGGITVKIGQLAAGTTLTFKLRVTDPEGLSNEKRFDATVMTDAEIVDYAKGSPYSSGAIVRHAGKFYRCKAGVSNWCSSTTDAYVPGEGFAWEQAWERV